MIKLITDKEIYTSVIIGKIPKAKKYLWIGTADMKDMYINKNGKMRPFLELLADLIKKGVKIRLIHAKEPGKNFMQDFDKYPVLFNGLERMLCPRVHFKHIIIDGNFAYSGSANLTGAGMGSKSETRRNFEAGFITDEQEHIDAISQQFDDVWIGKHCKLCNRKEYCTDCPIK
ncbi:MAG: phospholipase D-like domain-containing protein [Bacteroidales bacterium]|nr:phospholipase D-like domain-containing protein [Bacteroidales bacterium]